MVEGGLSEALATGSFNSGPSARSASAACRPCTREVLIDTAKEAQLVGKEQRKRTGRQSRGQGVGMLDQPRGRGRESYLMSCLIAASIEPHSQSMPVDRRAVPAAS